MNPSLQKLGIIVLILTLLVNPIFAAPDSGGNDGGTIDDQPETCGTFDFLCHAKNIFLFPSKKLYGFYNDMVGFYQSNLDPTNIEMFRSALGSLFYYFYMIVYYVLLFWLDLMVIQSLTIGNSETRYAQAKEMRIAFGRTLMAVIFSGFVAIVVMKIILLFVGVFGVESLTITSPPDQWGDFLWTIITGVILCILGLVLVILGFFQAFFFAVSLLLFAAGFIMKSSYGFARVMGAYLIFLMLYLSFIPVAFAFPAFVIRAIFIPEGTFGQTLQVIASLVLGFIVMLAYIKVGGKLFVLSRLQKYMGTFSSLKKATAESTRQMMTLGKAVGGAGVAAGAGAAYYTSHPGEAVHDAKNSVSSSVGGFKEKVSSGIGNTTKSFSSGLETVKTNYQHKNFGNLGDKSNAKNIKDLESFGVSHLIKDKSPGSTVSKQSRPKVDKWDDVIKSPDFIGQLVKETGYKKRN